MAKGSVVKVEGLPELIKALGQFEKKVFNKGLKLAFREGSKVIQKSIKAVAPVGKTKRLSKSFKVRAMKRKKNRSGVSVQIITKGTDAFYAPMIELGTKDRIQKRLGEKYIYKFVGKIKPRHFIKKGYDLAKEAAGARMVESLRDSIEAAAKEAKAAA